MNNWEYIVLQYSHDKCYYYASNLILAEYNSCSYLGEKCEVMLGTNCGGSWNQKSCCIATKLW